MKPKTIKLNAEAHAALIQKKADACRATGSTPSFSEIIIEALKC